MKPIVFKIGRNYSDHGTSIEYMSKCDDIVKSITSQVIGNITNISEYNEDYFILNLISDINDHLISYIKCDISNIPTLVIFGNKTIIELKDFNIFKYLGNSRIDGYPIFLVDDNTCKSYRRDYIIKELGL